MSRFWRGQIHATSHKDFRTTASRYRKFILTLQGASPDIILVNSRIRGPFQKGRAISLSYIEDTLLAPDASNRFVKQ